MDPSGIIMPGKRDGSAEWIKQIMSVTHKSSEISSCGKVVEPMPLTLAAEIAEFDRLRAWLQEFARKLELPEEITNRLLIAADEVFTNIASYAYPDASGKVEISAEQDGTMLRLTFTDTGKPFDPLQADDPNTKGPLSERKIGGLGIFVVKKMMDKVEYRREDDRNILTLTKCISPEVPSCS